MKQKKQLKLDPETNKKWDQRCKEIHFFIICFDLSNLGKKIQDINIIYHYLDFMKKIAFTNHPNYDILKEAVRYIFTENTRMQPSKEELALFFYTRQIYHANAWKYISISKNYYFEFISRIETLGVDKSTIQPRMHNKVIEHVYLFLNNHFKFMSETGVNLYETRTIRRIAI